MKLHFKAIKMRNWPLVIFGTIVFLFGLALMAVSVIFWRQFGWWSLAIFVSGFSSAIFSFLAVKQNKPELLLLNLILPN